MFLFRKKAAPAAEPVRAERAELRAAAVPAWLERELAGKLAAAAAERDRFMAGLENAVLELRSALRSLGKVEFAKGERMYAAANMAKDALVKKAESGLFGVKHESGTKGGQRLLASTAAAASGFREVPPKQIVLVTHYFVKEGGAVVAAVRETEAAAERLRRFFAGEGGLLVAQERVAELTAAIAKKEEQVQLVGAKVADAEREERTAAANKAGAEAELGQLLQGAEWRAWEAARAEWEQRTAKLARVREEWVALVRPLERAFRKAEHDGALAAEDAGAVRDWLAGARPGREVAEVLERFAAVAEEPAAVQKVAASAAVWLREEREWTEPARPAGPEQRRAELEQKAASAQALAERLARERERLATDQGKLVGELHDLVVDIEDVVLKGTGRTVSVQAAAV